VSTLRDSVNGKGSCVPAIHGHRGARGLYPENSLVAIEAGIEAGCDAIEVDLCVTADNHLVIHHDPILSPKLVRDNDNQWVTETIRIRDLNLAQLKTYDVGRIDPKTEYGEVFRTQAAVDGTTIPTLDEFVELVNKLGAPIVYNLELKSTPYDPKATPPVDEYIRLVIAALDKHKITERVFLQSFDWRLVIAAKTAIPALKIGFITDQQPDGNPISPISGSPSPWTDFQDVADYDNHLPAMIKALGGDVWSSNQLDLTENSIHSSHELGLEVYAWTVNSTTDMKRMIDFGVDVITTDYPDRLYTLING
jgi:glycerophosphoryl diester phosphodiesterase